MYFFSCGAMSHVDYLSIIKKKIKVSAQLFTVNDHVTICSCFHAVWIAAVYSIVVASLRVKEFAG